MSSQTPFGHVPTTAAALKALAAGGAARKGGPSPFQRALEKVSYHHWWILTALRVRTVQTAEKLRAAELAKLKAGLKTNSYGDLVSQAHGHTTQERRARSYGITVTEMHGFRKWKKRYSPIKSTHYVTSHLFDALNEVSQFTEIIAKQDAQLKAAHKAGFVSVKAHECHRIELEALLSQARVDGYHSGRLDERQSAQARLDPRASFTDLNDYGIATDRDVIDGDKLTLVNFNRTRSTTVSLVSFMNLREPAKNMRRDLGWRLPEYQTPVAPPLKRLPIRTRIRTIAA